MLAEFASAVALVFSGAAAQPAHPIIEISRLDERARVRAGTTQNILDRGVGHLGGSAWPGDPGLVSLWGHRVTPVGGRAHGPFRYINRLRRGDEIVLRMPYGTFRYEVTGHAVVPEARVFRFLSRSRADLTLGACHPLYSAEKRWIVEAIRTP